jgi:hypothetical protein
MPAVPMARDEEEDPALEEEAPALFAEVEDNGAGPLAAVDDGLTRGKKRKASDDLVDEERPRKKFKERHKNRMEKILLNKSSVPAKAMELFREYYHPEFDDKNFIGPLRDLIANIKAKEPGISRQSYHKWKDSQKNRMTELLQYNDGSIAKASEKFLIEYPEFESLKLKIKDCMYKIKRSAEKLN